MTALANDNLPAPNAHLREAVTTVAFSLTLTRNMVLVLDAVARGDRTASGAAVRMWVPTAWSLKRRGLVTHATDPDGWGTRLEQPDNMGRTRAMPEARPRDSVSGINHAYRLTRAGWLMHDLLAEAGLVDRVTARKQRRLVA
ncbi:hypothetical protein [Sphingomonas sp.]|uniref:hypothetical protein n=1 Tax=Sphingomonas sp. TaxID=28214 RepID=UPI0025D4BE0C|nr:hypothetical protein [Sphingomonas sp.]